MRTLSVLAAVAALLLILVAPTNALTPGPNESQFDIDGPLSRLEHNLKVAVNSYRREHGLPRVPVTKSLTAVARLHVRDLFRNRPDTGTGHNNLPCNTHSWSDRGKWTPICYTEDHYQSYKMWFKPKEITDGEYSAYGYEVSYRCEGMLAKPKDAIKEWRESEEHRIVILEQDAFSEKDWKAMGVAVYENYACVWFGDMVDPKGNVPDHQGK